MTVVSEKGISEHSSDDTNFQDAFDNIHIKEAIMILCTMKVDEFRLYGYEDINYKQVWACVSDKYRHELPRIYKLVNDILSLDALAFMDWMLVGVYKGQMR